MPIIETRAISYNQMVEFVKTGKLELPGPPPNPSIKDFNIISITDHDIPKIFSQDSERVLTLVFSDIDPQNIDFIPEPNDHFMKPEQAKATLDFIEKIHAKPEDSLLLINCIYGQCRSGAVADFTANILGLGFWDTRNKNPQIVPNYWVRYLLLNEFFSRKYNKTQLTPTTDVVITTI